MVKLETIENLKTLEEDETVLFKMRSKIFRFDKPTNQWKERGTGECRLLQRVDTGKVRILMRRDQTHKICANHLILPEMTLTPNIGSDRSWMWTAVGDMSEGEPSTELLAIRFANAENANLFKKHFEEAQLINSGNGNKNSSSTEDKAEELESKGETKEEDSKEAEEATTPAASEHAD